MKKNFTKQTANFGCYNESKKQNNYLPNKSFTISDVLNSDVSLRDKAWFIRNNCEFTNDEYSQFAIGCALCVLPIYESKYPGNNAPRKAIEAAQKYLANEIGIDELREARRAADAAAYAAAAVVDAAAVAYAAAAAAAYAAAADAAAVADAAAYAAAAAVAYAAAAADAAAAAAAADAAYAADAAAAAADAYAADAAGKVSYKGLLLEFFKEFTSVEVNQTL